MIEKIREFIKKVMWKRKLKRLDDEWRFSHGCFDMYPPSFYLTHTPEEVERIQDEDFKRIREKIAELREIEGTLQK